MTGLTHTTHLVVVTCWCGMPHAVPEELRDKQSRDHRDGRKQTGIYCPLGHTYIIAGEGEAAKLERSLQWERDRSARLAAARDQAEAHARAQKAAKTRIKNQRDRERQRAANGVCPCCHRSFQDLRRHMESKHPDFPPADVE